MFWIVSADPKYLEELRQFLCVVAGVSTALIKEMLGVFVGPDVDAVVWLLLLIATWAALVLAAGSFGTPLMMAGAALPHAVAGGFIREPASSKTI